MRHDWKGIQHRLTQAVTLLALFVLIQGAGYAQSLAFSPGLTSVVAGDPSIPPSLTPSPATYVGPADGLVPDALFGEAIDKYGNIYLSEAGGNIIRVIASGNGPIPVLSNPTQPNYVASPQAGYVYTVAGTGITSGVTNPVSPSCTTATGEMDTYGDGCLATQAIGGIYTRTVKGVATHTSFLYGIAVDGNGNLYIADYYAGLIRVVYAGGSNNPVTSLLSTEGISSPTQGYIYAIAGIPGTTTAFSRTPGAATSVSIGEPKYLAVDPNGNIYFPTGAGLLALSVSGNLPGITNHTIGYVYAITGDSGTTVGNGVPASSVPFPGVTVAIDASGNIYTASGTVVSVIYVGGSVPGLTGLEPGYIYTVAGGGTTVPSFFTATPAASAKMSPASVAMDQAGNLYVTDGSIYVIYKIDPSGNVTEIYGPNRNSGGGLVAATCPSAVDLDEDGCPSDITSGDFAPLTVVLDAEGNLYVPSNTSQSQLFVLHESNVTTSSLYFTAGQTQPVVIYNTGAKPLTLTSFAASSPFTVVPVSPAPTGFIADCSTVPTLQPGESCESSVELPSSNTSGTTGTLTVASNSTNATNGANVIQLTGESATLSPTTVLVDTTPPNSIPAQTQESLAFDLVCSTCKSSPYPTGTLTLYDNGSPLASVLPQTVTNNSSNSNDVTYNFNNVVFPTGSNLVYAVYSGDTNYQSSQSYQALITVNGTASTTMLTANPTTAATGSNITLMATVTSSSGNPSDGTVTFKNGNTVIGQAAVSGGSASVSTTAPSAAGTTTYTASYAGSTTYNPSTSSAAVTVQAPINTATGVSTSSNSPAEGATVTLTATVTAASGTSAPIGTVQFQSNGMNIGTPQMVTASTGATAVATLNIGNLPEGKDIITASYSGSSDGLFLASQTTTASSTTVNVGLPATMTTVTPATGSITYGSSYTFTAAVAQQVSNIVPTGTVTFTAGSTTLGPAVTLSGGSATFTTTLLPGGSSQVTDTVIATYNDPTNTFASSTGTASVLVTPVGTTTSTPTSSNLNPVSGQTLTLTATVAAIGGSVQPTGTVTFYNGSTTLCSGALTNGSASCSPSLQQGAASITAVYVGGNGFATSTSSALSLNVAPPSASTSTTLVASTATPTTTQPVTFTATVTNTTNGSTGIPTGVVTFQSGSNLLGTESLSGSGVATLTTTFTTTGMYPVVAIYQGNSSYTGSTSAIPLTVTVTQALAMSTTSLTLSSSAVQQGQNVTFTATVGPNTPVTPSGNVNFMSGSTLIGTGTLNGGIATYSTTALGAGSYSVTANYVGDQNYSGSQSTATALTVALPTPSFTLSATPTNLTVTSGQTGAAIITLVPTYDYAGTVTLTCGTLPANVTCSFAPATLTADGKNDAVQSTLTISTNNGTAQLHQPGSFWRGRNNSVLSAALLFFPAGLLGLGFTDKRKRLNRYLSLAVLLFLGTGLLAISGCAGGNGGSTTDAAKGTAQITVTAAGSAGSQMQTVNLSVTIQ